MIIYSNNIYLENKKISGFIKIENAKITDIIEVEKEIPETSLNEYVINNLNLIKMKKYLITVT